MKQTHDDTKLGDNLMSLNLSARDTLPVFIHTRFNQPRGHDAPFSLDMPPTPLFSTSTTYMGH